MGEAQDGRGVTTTEDRVEEIELWVDDARPPPPGWTHARTAGEAIEILASGVHAVSLSLDDDLGSPAAGSGHDVAKWIEGQILAGNLDLLPHVYGCHGADPAEQERIWKVLRAAHEAHGRQRVPFEHPLKLWVDAIQPPPGGGWTWAGRLSEAVALLDRLRFDPHHPPVVWFGDSLGPQQGRPRSLRRSSRGAPAASRR